MKNPWLLLLLLPPALAFTQIQPLDFEEISKALGNGNAPAIVSFVNGDVEIDISGEEDIYTKDEALVVLKSFFSKNKPSSFELVHTGSSKNKESHYCIGDLKTNSTTFRVYIYWKKTGEKQFFIKEMRFDS